VPVHAPTTDEAADVAEVADADWCGLTAGVAVSVAAALVRDDAEAEVTVVGLLVGPAVACECPLTASATPADAAAMTATAAATMMATRPRLPACPGRTADGTGGIAWPAGVHADGGPGIVGPGRVTNGGAAMGVG
jgi:hypothetical protein